MSKTGSIERFLLKISTPEEQLSKNTLIQQHPALLSHEKLTNTDPLPELPTSLVFALFPPLSAPRVHNRRKAAFESFVSFPFPQKRRSSEHSAHLPCEL